jgi:hypothetical protein
MDIKYIDTPKDFQEAVGVRYGYFTGGPNGDVYLNLTKDANASPTLYFYLKDGKELITIEGVSIPIYNSEAFDGWKD